MQPVLRIALLFAHMQYQHTNLNLSLLAEEVENFLIQVVMVHLTCLVLDQMVEEEEELLLSVEDPY